MAPLGHRAPCPNTTAFPDPAVGPMRPPRPSPPPTCFPAANPCANGWNSIPKPWTTCCCVTAFAVRTPMPSSPRPRPPACATASCRPPIRAGFFPAITRGFWPGLPPPNGPSWTTCLPPPGNVRCPWLWPWTGSRTRAMSAPWPARSMPWAVAD